MLGPITRRTWLVCGILFCVSSKTAANNSERSTSEAGCGTIIPGQLTPRDRSLFYYAEGRRAYAQRRYLAAIDCFRLSLEEERNIATLYSLGRSYERHGDQAHAEQFFRECIVSPQEDVEAHDACRRRLHKPPMTQPLFLGGLGLSALGVGLLVTGVGLHVLAIDEKLAFDAETSSSRLTMRDRAQALGLGSLSSYTVGGACVLSGAIMLSLSLWRNRNFTKNSSSSGQVVLVPLLQGAQMTWTKRF